MIGSPSRGDYPAQLLPTHMLDTVATKQIATNASVAVATAPGKCSTNKPAVEEETAKHQQPGPYINSLQVQSPVDRILAPNDLDQRQTTAAVPRQEHTGLIWRCLASRLKGQAPLRRASLRARACNEGCREVNARASCLWKAIAND